jgi:hypothetical protein
MQLVTEKHVKDLECGYGESLLDTNHWHSNAFTIYGLQLLVDAMNVM